MKVVDASTQQRWAVIPGIFRGIVGEDGLRDEAFVQVLDGSTGRSWFHTFDVTEFEADARSFNVRVGANRFSSSGVHLELPGLSGDLSFTTPFEPWPVRAFSPGVMGWYGLLPIMECYHGVISFGHDLAGSLRIDGVDRDFDGGRGYIEKDWGVSFPAGYVWLHSNHFASDPDASFIGSVAIIPWRRSRFRGFIVGLRHGGRLYRWATYTRARERELIITDDHIDWTLRGRDGELHVRADRVRGGLLHAPLRSEPHRRVEETLDARIRITHTDRKGQVVFDDVGEVGAMEVFGDIEALLGTPVK